MMAGSTPIFDYNVIFRMSTNCKTTSILERILLQDEALKVQFKFNHALLPFDIAELMFFEVQSLCQPALVGGQLSPRYGGHF
jgi:hypothetical protein